MARIANHTSEETKNQIIDAFLSLYEQYPIEKISIRMLSEKAKINRGTFYYYYTDIYALFEEIENDMIQKLLINLPHIVEGFLRGEFDRIPEYVFEFYLKNYKYVVLLLVVKPDQKLVEAVKRCAKTAVLSFFHKKEKELSMEEQCMLEYTVNAQFGTVCWWLLHTDEMSLETLIGLLQRLSMHGPFTVLKETL